MLTMTTDAEKYRRKTKSRRNKQPRQTRAAILSRYFPRTEDGDGADRTATLKQLAMQGMRGKPYGGTFGVEGRTEVDLSVECPTNSTALSGFCLYHLTCISCYRRVKGGGGTQFMHRRSLNMIDPRTPTMPGRSTLGFHRPGRHCVHQARSVVRCSASRIKDELHPTKSQLWGGLPHFVRAFLHIG